MTLPTLWIVILLFAGTGVGCSNNDEASNKNVKAIPAVAEQDVVVAKVVPYTLVAKFPHDTTAFTQGLVVSDGMLLETTGQYGISDIRLVDIKSGRVVKKTSLPQEYFGEGVAVVGNKAYALTWMNQKAIVFNRTTLVEETSFQYVGEGWGLASNGTQLYMSNGTNIISVRDPKDFRITSSIAVTRNGKAQQRINELEWVNGELWANVWQSEEIIRIDPTSGVVTGVIDCTGILPLANRPTYADVFNGIAFDPTSNTVYVTGKNWPWVYQIEIP